MALDRGSRITGLFHEALGRSPVERAAFLDVGCKGDQGLRDEVERLLAAHDSGDSFLEFRAIPPSEPMRFEAGSVLGAYTISSFIGAGGMGEVYRARDPRLGRDVAIKILPAEAAADAERRARFAREARAIAALNHPNIVTVYSVEQSGDVHFLTMELVEGQTLREVIPRGGCAVDRLIDLAIPIAEAIGAAHAQHIVHRDLKPANVMVTRSGRVKILDFGIAKLVEPTALPGDPAGAVPTAKEELPTASRLVGTAAGHVVGTVDYMSPEQVEGREVDHRTDLFSLGIVLFELATGQRPFAGGSVTARLASILNDTPPLVTEVRPDVPPAFARLVRRCLAKTPERRYQSAIDVRNELEEIKQEKAASPVPTAGERFAIRAWAGRRAMWFAAGLLLASVIGAGYLTVFRQTPAATSPPLRLPIAPPTGVAIAPQGAPPILAISPDGQWIAFHGVISASDRLGLYLKAANQIEAAHLVPGEGGSPFFSPDSRWLGYWSNGAIWKVRVDGGEPVRICDANEQLRGASWSDSGIIVFSIGGHLWRVAETSGTPEPLAPDSPDQPRYYFPHVLPGGRTALVMRLHDKHVALVSLETGELIRPLFPGSSPRYVEPGLLVFRLNETLYVAPFDRDRGVVTSEPRDVLDGVSYNPGGSQTSGFDVSRSGALVYIPLTPTGNEQLVWIDPHGRSELLDERKANFGPPSIDPKGHRVAVNITTDSGGDLWQYDVASRNRTPLTTGGHTTGATAYSSDGNWIISTSTQWGSFALFRLRAAGGDPEQLTGQVTDGSATAYLGARAYDYVTSIWKNTVMFSRQTGAGLFDLLTLTLDPPGKPTPFLRSGPQTRNGRFSPNGRWVAYTVREAGASQIFVKVLSPVDRSRVPVASEADFPYWSHDGRHLFFRKNGEIWTMAITDTTNAEFRAGTATVEVTRSELGDDTTLASFQPSPDGTRFLVVRRPNSSRRLVFVPNWGAEVQATLRTPR